MKGDRPANKSGLREESGATLVETLVALSILVSVLLPASLFLGYVAYSPRNKDQIQAIGLAQSAMEQTLERHDYVSRQKKMNNGWVIRQEVTHHHELVSIDVNVYVRGDTIPAVSFHTERLYQKPEGGDAKN